jgi:hypothetical protein
VPFAKRFEPLSLTRYLFGFNDQSIGAVPVNWMVAECTATMAMFRSPGGEECAAEYERMRLSKTTDGKQLKVEVDF